MKKVVFYDYDFYFDIALKNDLTKFCGRKPFSQYDVGGFFIANHYQKTKYFL